MLPHYDTTTTSHYHYQDAMMQEQQQTGTSARDPITVDSTTEEEDDQQSRFGAYHLLDHPQHSFDTLTDAEHFALSPGGLELSPTIIREPMGNISPIQVTYGRTQALFGETSVIPEDWKQIAVEEQSSDPVRVLDAAKEAFVGFKYILHSVQTNNGHSSGHDSPEASCDRRIAIRRVETAVCAFGGQVTPELHKPSVFRSKESMRKHYEETLQSRYKVKGAELQWEVEENPPVVVPSAEDDAPEAKKLKLSESSISDLDRSKTPESHDPNKMKYHCKRCGQIKQNHNCPYRQKLQRSIGVIVFPVVNSYTAAEPGEVAAPLTKMNNFVSYDSEEQTSPKSHSVPPFPNAITPDAQQDHFLSPQSSLSVQSHEYCEVLGVKRKCSSLRTPPSERSSTLFAETVALKPEHYRAVSPSEDVVYSYPPIPVSFAERKRLSDTLFFLAREIPHLANECAMTLREARKNYEWDLAVAELLTQVVVGLYCSEGDSRLDGLQQYLLSLGVSC